MANGRGVGVQQLRANEARAILISTCGQRNFASREVAKTILRALAPNPSRR